MGGRLIRFHKLSSAIGFSGGGARGGRGADPHFSFAPCGGAPHFGAVLRQYELVEKVKGYDPDADEALINRAYVFSMKAHGSQTRASGDPYYSHPIEVAGILTDLHLDDETIVTAILHDTIEDTLATPAEIKKLFGKNVARLVDGVTKLSKIEAQSESQRAAENLRKFLLARSDDIRVLLVKLADRLHNMRTLHHLKDPGEAPPHRPGDDGHLRPARRADRHVRVHDRDADPRLPRAGAGRLCLDHEAAGAAERRRRRRPHPADRPRDPGASGGA